MSDEKNILSERQSEIRFGNVKYEKHIQSPKQKYGVSTYLLVSKCENLVENCDKSIWKIVVYTDTCAHTYKYTCVHSHIQKTWGKGNQIVKTSIIITLRAEKGFQIKREKIK